MAKTIRTFVAAPLSPEILKTADGIQQQLKQLGLKFRWVRPANIHLTIKFLGRGEERDAGVAGALLRF